MTDQHESPAERQREIAKRLETAAFYAPRLPPDWEPPTRRTPAQWVLYVVVSVIVSLLIFGFMLLDVAIALAFWGWLVLKLTGFWNMQ